MGPGPGVEGRLVLGETSQLILVTVGAQPAGNVPVQSSIIPARKNILTGKVGPGFRGIGETGPAAPGGNRPRVIVCGSVRWREHGRLDRHN